MVRQTVMDTNILEDLNTDRVVVPDGVSGELESRKVNDGLVDDVVDARVKTESQCVNDNIEEDIKKAFRRGGRSKRVKDKLVEATKQRNERNRQKFLQDAYEALPSDTKSKSWQGQVAGAKTDCQVLKAGEDADEVITNDKSILQACDDREDVECRRMDITG